MRQTQPISGSAGGAARRPDERGSSLVELMMATVLTVVGFVSVMEGCVRLHALQRVDEELGHAFRACRTAIEGLHARPLAELPAFDGTGFEVPGPDGATPLLRALPGDPDGMPGHLQVVQERTAGDRSLYRIVASVRWAGAGGNQSVQFTTLWGGAP